MGSYGCHVEPTVIRCSGSDGYDEAPMLPADIRERACRQLAATRTDMDNRFKDLLLLTVIKRD